MDAHVRCDLLFVLFKAFELIESSHNGISSLRKYLFSFMRVSTFWVTIINTKYNVFLYKF